MSTHAADHATAELPARRANAFHALARVYSPPDTWPEDLSRLLESAFTPLGGTLSELSRQLVAQLRLDENQPEELAPVHARLFVGPFDIQAPPWASLYLDPEQQLMGETSRYAAEAYAEVDLGPVAGPNDAPDHLTHELEFMYFLAYRECETADEQWRERQLKFWHEHLGKWLPHMAALVLDAGDDTLVYRSLGDLTLAFCQWLEEENAFSG